MAMTAIASGASGSFDASENRVKPNEGVTLSGRFVAPKAASTAAASSRRRVQGVRIQFRASGAENWQDAERTRTGRTGRFSERVQVERSGRFRAVSADGRVTASEYVRVKSVTRARVADETVKQGDKVAIKGHVAPAGTSAR